MAGGDRKITARRIRQLILVSAASGMMLGSVAASAVTKTYDTNAAGQGINISNGFTWVFNDTTTWTSDGGVTKLQWTDNTDTANFVMPQFAAGILTSTANGAIGANGLLFSGGAYGTPIPVLLTIGTTGAGTTLQLGAGGIQDTGYDYLKFQNALQLTASQTWSATKLGRLNSSNYATAGAIVVTGAISGTGDLTIDGSGSGNAMATGNNDLAVEFTLSGANTFSGSTTITGGGFLRLDYSSNANRIDSNSALTFAGGTLVMNNGSGFVQNVTGTTVGSGANSIVAGPSGAGVGKSQIALGAISHTSGGTLDVTSSIGSLAFTTTGNTNGILGGWATLGNGTFFATGSSDGVTSTAISSTSGTNGNVESAWTSTSNINITSSGLGTGQIDTTVNSLRLGTSNAAIAPSLTSGVTVTIASGGLIGGGAVGQSLNGGSLTTGFSTGELFVYSGGTNPSNFTLNSTIVDNATAQPNTILVKGGANTLTLGGTNTYSGGTYINTGVLKISTDANLGAAPLSAATNVTFPTYGMLATTSSFTLNSNRGISIGTLTGSGSAMLDVAPATTLSYGGVMADAGGKGSLVKTNTGTLTVFGSNTYTGATAIDGGTLALDFSQAGAASDIVSASSLLNLAGGTLNVIGKSSTANSQTFNGLNISSGASTIVASSAALNNVLVNLGAITRVPGGTVNFTQPGGTISATNGFTTTTNNNGILGGYATIGGVDFADNNGTAIVPASYGNDTWAVGSNTTVTLANNTITAGTTSSLRFNAPIAATLTLSGTNFVSSGGILVTPNVGNNLTTINGDTLNGSNSQDLIVDQYNTEAGLTIAATIANRGNITALTKSGPGLLTLSGSNTYTGATYINGGTLSISADNNLGTAPTTTTAGDISINGGTLLATSSFTLSASRLISLGAANGPGSGTISVANGQNLTYGGALSGNAYSGSLDPNDGGTASLIKTGGGTLTLFRGSSVSNAYTGSTIINAGTVALDFSQSAVTSAILNGSNLVLGGGTLNVIGKSATTTSQTINGLSVSPGDSAIVDSSVSGANQAITLGFISRGVGGTVNITQPSGTLATNNGIVTNTGNTTGGILGGWATVGGTDWATSAGTSSGAAAIGALSSYVSDTWAAGNNTTVTLASNAAYDNVTTNSLRFNTAAADVVTLSGTNLITSGGILVTNAVGSNASQITGGTLEGANGQDLVVIQNNADLVNGGLTIDSVIADNTSTTGFTKSGAGLLTLTGINTYSGPTYINAGTVVAASDSAFGNDTAATAGLILNPSSAVTVNFTSVAPAIASLSNSGAGNSSVVLGNIATPGATSLSVGGNNVSTTFNGVISDLHTTNAAAVGNLVKVGTGSLSLAGINTYTGNTTVNEGTLDIPAGGAIASGNVSVGSGAVLDVDANTPGSGLSGAPNVTAAGAVNFAAGGSGILVRTLGTLNVSGTVTVAAVSADNHANRTVLITSALTNTGKIELNNNDMVVRNTDSSVLFSQLQMGFNAGAGYWNGASGIASTSAASDSRFLTTLGYRQSDGSAFDGTNTTTSDTEVKYTYYGDANLDGTVNGADYQQIDLGFGSGATGWSNGDFNYDGVVNGSDFALIDNTFNQLLATGASPLAIIASPSSLVAAPATLSAVPEPTTLGLLAIGAIGALGRRRRRSM